MSYENPWTFDGEVFDTKDIGKFAGFVYCIINTLDNRKYIGRKYFYSIRKVKGKKNRQRKESDWKTYYGSSDILKEDIEKHGIDCFKRIILSLHITRGDCNFEEVKRQFHHNVLEEEGWYNANISGKYHRKPNHIRDARSVTKVVL